MGNGPRSTRRRRRRLEAARRAAAAEAKTLKPRPADDDSHRWLRDGLIAAVGFGSAAASLATLSGWHIWLALALIAAALSALVPMRKLTIGAASVATGLFVVTLLVALSNAGRGDHRRPYRARSSGSVPPTAVASLLVQGADRGAATSPLGYYPPRPATPCSVAASCSSASRPALDALRFTGGSFFEGIGDERAFVDAQVVGPTEAQQPYSDPVHVAPGDNLRIAGLIDNSGRSSMARGVRAIIALPPGNGDRQVVFSAVSGSNTQPAAISDSVVVLSKVPVYLTYEWGSSDVYRGFNSLYRPGNAIVTTYDPSLFDRRVFGSQGVLVGCHRRDGIVPGGRTCAFRYEAIFAVRYAAVRSVDVNSAQGIQEDPATGTAHVAGHQPVGTYFAPDYASYAGYLTVTGGRKIDLDCTIIASGVRWYHLSDVDSQGNFYFDMDTGFLPAEDLSHVTGRLPGCAA